MAFFDMINSFLNPEDAYSAARRPLNRGYETAKGYEEPFIRQGQDQYSSLNNARNMLMHPEALLAKWMQGYETSPFAKQQLAGNLESGNEAASSMGLMGSSGALNSIQTGASNIRNADRREFLNDLMQKYMTGIGLGKDIYGIGANMGAHLGGQTMSNSNNLAQLAYGEKAAPGQLLERLLQTGMNAGGAYMLGGFGE